MCAEADNSVNGTPGADAAANLYLLFTHQALCLQKHTQDCFLQAFQMTPATQ